MAAAAAAAQQAAADVEAALREADKAAKKQKLCATASANTVDQLLQVGMGEEAGCAPV